MFTPPPHWEGMLANDNGIVCVKDEWKHGPFTLSPFMLFSI